MQTSTESKQTINIVDPVSDINISHKSYIDQCV